jgi:Flp pilus assembly protein TadD
MTNNLGMCWLMRGDYAKASEEFTRACGLAPQNARYRSNLAVALGMMGRYDESLALFAQVVPAGTAHYNLYVICQARKDPSRASREYALAEEGGFQPKDAAPKTSEPASP